MPSRLSVCTLTRDEERNIERALGSVAGIADEVIVADAGSSDRTVEIAKNLGAKVVPIAWDDDFSDARNKAVQAAQGDWILWINPDEELVSPGREAIRSLMEACHAKLCLYGAAIQDIARGERLDQFSLTTDIRLYRKCNDFRYVGRLHPALTLENDTLEPGRFSPSELVIRRHSYTSTLDEGKVRWAIRLLELELSERPGSLHYVIEYGRNLLLLNDPRGHDVMCQAIASLQPHISRPTPPDPDVQVLLEYAINTPKAFYRGSIAPGMAVILALKWFPESPPLIWSLAQACFKSNQIQAAAGYLERLVQLQESGRFDRSRAFDPRIMGSWALMNLGQCKRVLGDEAAAKACFEALRSDPEFAAEAARLLEVQPPA